MALITVNGKRMQITHTTVALVLRELALDKGRYAVEVNGELVPKSELGHTSIKEDMVIEIVHAVGGG